MIKISLIIPIYKIEAVLESINYQTYRNFEVIVAEDNNTLGGFIKNIKQKLNYKKIKRRDGSFYRSRLYDSS